MGSSFGDSAIGAAISAGGSMISSLIGVNAAKKQAARQQRYNKELAEIQNQYNIAQWNRENAYNLPVAQIERLQEAGLNPNLVYGQPNNTAAASPFLTSGNAANLQDLPHLGTAFSSAIDNYLKMAQADNIKADTDNKKTEGSILQDQASFTKAIQENMVAEGKWKLTLAEDTHKYNQEQLNQMLIQTKKLNNENEILMKNLDVLDSQLQGMDYDNKIKKVQAFFASDKAKMELRHMAASINAANASAHCTMQQAENIAFNLTMQRIMKQDTLEQYSLETDMKRLGVTNMSIQNDQLDYNLDQQKEFKYVDKGLQIFGAVTSGVGSIISSATQYMKATAPVEHKRFTKTNYNRKGEVTSSTSYNEY